MQTAAREKGFLSTILSRYAGLNVSVSDRCLRQTMTGTNQLKADDPDLVFACPRCDSADIGIRSARHNRLNDGDGRYRCGSCCLVFDEGIERPTKRTGGGRKGLAGQLARIGEQRHAEGGTP